MPKYPPMPFDKEALDELQNLLEHMTTPQLVRFCEGMLKTAHRAQQVLMTRSLPEWNKFNVRVEAGEII